METTTDLLIIGAGPFGLAIAAYAQHLGLDHKVVGKPMQFWKENMPKGMRLRSACDWHLDAVGKDTMKGFLNTRGLTAARVEPISLELYLDYAQWFQEQKQIKPLPLLVQRLDLSPNEHRFHAVMNDDQVIIANQVVVAVGFKYFKHLPVELSQVVPAGRLSHTCDLVDFAALRGKRCLILGGRQSAFEWAALIHEAGAAAVHVCHRHDSPAFKASDWSWATPLVNTVVHQPAWFRNLFAEEQEDLHQRLWAEGRLKVEPWLERRVLHETIKLWPRTRVIEVTAEPDGELAVKLDNGQRLVVDHIIAATGYKVDIARVPFLAEGNLFPRVAIRNGYPVLDEHFQTSVRGLFITSMAAAQDFGPFWAFTIAAPASAKIIGHALLSSKSFA